MGTTATGILKKGGCENEIIPQYAKDVISFSSQYGSESGISYQVPNLIGHPNIYPNYGDYTSACVFRTYGKWWINSPSSNITFMRYSNFFSEDYVDLLFETHVVPTKLDIFETYNPGSIVRILAFVDYQHSNTPRWEVIWRSTNSKAPASSRIFNIEFEQLHLVTNVLRIEINQSLLDYYTELDAVCLYGISASSIKNNLNSLSVSNKAISVNDLKNSSEYVVEELSKLHLCEGISAALDNLHNGFFDLLPAEVLLYILSFLDFTSIGRLAATSKELYKYCYDHHLYTELNLQPYWHKIDSESLKFISSRCQTIKKLSLSWCGTLGLLNSQSFQSFVDKFAENITVLHLACCTFLNSSSFHYICTRMTNLEDFDLNSCVTLDSNNFQHIVFLKMLRRINLYRTKIDLSAFILLVQNNNQLEHINIGSCSFISDIDEACKHIGLHCSNLKSLDMWRSRTLTSNGLNEISSKCIYLEELDIGWCSKDVSRDSIIELVNNCSRLRKLFLTAYRALSDTELNEIADLCPFLEQLDILGTSEISVDSVCRVLNKCPHMKMLDLSFCAHIDFFMKDKLCMQYPHVDIKKSFCTD